MANIQNLIGGATAFNLALNVAGIILNKKNVALYILNENTGGKKDIFESVLSSLGSITNIANVIGKTTHILDCEIIENSRLTEQPLEDGKVLSDNKIKLPTEINVRVVLPAYMYQDTLKDLKKYKDENQSLYIETKFGNYKNMQIVSLPCSMDISNVDRLTFTIRLKEILVAISEEDKNNTTKNTGLKEGVDTNEDIGAIL